MKKKLEFLFLFVVVTTLVSAQELPTKTSSVPDPIMVSEEGIKKLTDKPKGAPLIIRDVRKHHLPTPINPIDPDFPKPKVVPPDTLTKVNSAVIAPAVSKVTVLQDRILSDLDTNDATSTISEPTVAIRNKEIFITANWFAAFSRGPDIKFKYLSPYEQFPVSDHGEFCCDQAAAYNATNDLLVWVLQYNQNETGNIFRLAVAQGNDISVLKWRYYDFSPSKVGGWMNEWFDYPDVAFGKDFLYITFNMYSSIDDRFTRGVILRLPLAKLKIYKGFSYQYYDAPTMGSFRLVRGAADVMYFGTHGTRASLRVFTWPENKTTLTMKVVSVEPWSDFDREAAAGDGRPWLKRLDRRITAAWLSNQQLGFAWSGSQDLNYRFPHIRVAIMNAANKTNVVEPHLWNPDYAFAYPAVAPNTKNVMGLSFFYGGRPINPSHGVGVLVNKENQWKWELISTLSGDNGPDDFNWGDFLCVQTLAGSDSWATIGYALKTGPSDENVEVHYLEFEYTE